MVFKIRSINEKSKIGKPKNQYVQFKITDLMHHGQTWQILQILDVSANIMYDKQFAQNSFLSLINACVSHELRNPLNSIMA